MRTTKTIIRINLEQIITSNLFRIWCVELNCFYLYNKMIFLRREFEISAQKYGQCKRY